MSAFFILCVELSGTVGLHIETHLRVVSFLMLGAHTQ